MVSSTENCENSSLFDLGCDYENFADRTQIYIKAKTQNFPNVLEEEINDLNDEHELQSIRLVNGNNSKIIKEWNGPNSQEFISIYNKEIKSAILSHLTKYGDKLQIKIKVNEKIKEFVFWEFIDSGDCVEFTNCWFLTQKECYLDFFPKKLYVKNHLLYFQNFLNFISYLLREKFEGGKIESANITEGENIKSSSIKTFVASKLFFDMKRFKQPSVFKFTDFDLSLRNSEESYVMKRTSEMELSIKLLTVFFEPTKNVSKINFDVFIPYQKDEKGPIESKKISLEISSDEKIKIKDDQTFSFYLVELQKEENFLNVILGRPTGDIRNPLRTKDSLSFKFMNTTGDDKLTKIFFDAEDEVVGDYTYTTFALKKDGKSSSLYDGMIRSGLISITLNGVKGLIGTYGICLSNYGRAFFIYSDKLISFPPFAAEENDSKRIKTRILTKNTIIIIIAFVVFVVAVILIYFGFEKTKRGKIS